MKIKPSLDKGRKGVKLSENFNFNDSENLIQFKIVYWGLGESGKTRNFIRLSEKFMPIFLII